MVPSCQRARQQRRSVHLGRLYDDGKGVLKNDGEAVRLFRLAAAQKHPRAQLYLGFAYAQGDGVEKNEVEAATWFRLASEQGNSDAQFSLGRLYDDGKGVPKNDTEAVRLYRLAAAQKHDRAQLYLGFAYALGDGVEKNETEAATWFRLASEQGNSDAQFNLGRLYDDGKGVPKDDSEAVRLYRVAAAKKHERAQLYLGFAYALGDGVEKNETEAASWFRLAADQGNPDAQFRLGLFYDKGRGVAKNESEATRWFRAAAVQGHKDAAEILLLTERIAGLKSAADSFRRGSSLFEADMIREAIEAFEEAGRQGMTAGYRRAARLRKNYPADITALKQGYSVFDPAEFTRLTRLAAVAGDAEAQVDLAWDMSERAGADRAMHAEALSWLRIAAESGHLPALRGLTHHSDVSWAEQFMWATVVSRLGSQDDREDAAFTRKLLLALITPDQASAMERRAAEWKAKPWVELKQRLPQ